ncbi:MAG: electron transfer flavoprotein subunit alpha/FixB family protein [Deltaproteobacteria bacterium]|nr:electron transfer flavoprotein subunit alpha/FixB family protein [Deltaproteobacteria bacterium]
MGNTLVIAEVHNGALRKATLTAVTFAKKAAANEGGAIFGLVVGSGVGAVADDFRRFGLAKVFVADNAAYQHALATTYAAVVAEVVKENGVTLVTATATAFGKDLLPRVAAKLDAGMVSDISDVVDGSTFVRPLFAGNALARVKVSSTIKVVSVRGTAFDAAKPAGNAADVVAITSAPADAVGTTFVRFDETKSARPELTEAQTIVSFGRGLKGPENIPIVEKLCDALGAGLGATRAVVDAGWVPNDFQIGQTGKVVAPTLYFAVGLSGAIQHVAGMKDSKVIVAINKDAEAPIFKVSDYGLVGDLFKVVPELVEAIIKAKAS